MHAMEVGILRFCPPLNLNFKRLACTFGGFQSYFRYRDTRDVKVCFCSEFKHAEWM